MQTTGNLKSPVIVNIYRKNTSKRKNVKLLYRFKLLNKLVVDSVNINN